MPSTVSHHMQQGPGDILVFLTGREDIDNCCQELSDMLPSFVVFLILLSCINLFLGTGYLREHPN